LQQFNTARRNIAGHNMFRAFGLHPVATCCDTLGFVGSNLKMHKFFQAQFVDVMLYLIGQVRATMLLQGMRISSITSNQHVATPCNKVAKRTQHVAPNDVAICCDRLAGSCKYWANNVALK